jgi:hypothetical protein
MAGEKQKVLETTAPEQFSVNTVWFYKKTGKEYTIIFFKSTFCYFAHPGLQKYAKVYLLQIKTYCYKANDTAYSTMQARNNFFLHFIKLYIYNKMLYNGNCGS